LDEIISDIPDIQIELRTKTDNVDFLGTLKNKEKFSVVFTLSPENVVERLENKTASLARRIEAARKCQEFGINVGLRFEPIINTKTLLEDYRKTVELIADMLNTGKIQSIGVSCLRFTKGLMKKLEKTAPELLLDEFVVCPDGKYRYFRPIRTRIYIQLIALLKEKLPNVKLFLSTEPAYIWKDCGLSVINFIK